MNADLGFLSKEPQTNLLKTWQGKCFACSPHNEHGLKLSFTHTPGYCFTRYKIPPEYCGFETMAHGGIIATLLDEVSGWTIMTNLFKFAFTVEANIKYLKPVPVNTEIIIVGHIISEQAQNIIMKASIILPSGLILAEMDSKWFAPNKAQATKITGRNEGEIEKYAGSAFEEIKKALGVVESSP